MKIDNVIVALIAIIGGLSFMKDTAKPVDAAIREETLTDLYKKHAGQKGVDWRLLRAIAITESSENPNAKNPLDPSYGLMQLLARTDNNGHITNRLNVQDWPPDNVEALYDPDYSLHIAAQILKWNMVNYGVKRGIAIYNMWAAHSDPVNGPYQNQGYVDKVWGHYTGMGGSEADANTGIY